MSRRWHPDVDTSALTEARCDELTLALVERIDLQVAGIVGGKAGHVVPAHAQAVLIELVWWKGRDGALELVAGLRRHAREGNWRALAQAMRTAAESLPGGQRERMIRLAVVLERETAVD